MISKNVRFYKSNGIKGGRKLCWKQL